jgi:hypothetical protein
MLVQFLEASSPIHRGFIAICSYYDSSRQQQPAASCGTSCPTYRKEDIVSTRRTLARTIRQEAAEHAFLRPHPEHLNNGEESAYRSPDPTDPTKTHLSYIANFSKGLPHDATTGEVEPEAYRSLLRCLASGNPQDFEQVQLGPGGRKLTNPQAGLAFDLEGPDAHSLTIPPAPRIDSPENSAEMGELYWMALLRDVNFTDFDTDTNVGEAADSLSDQFSDFRGPKDPVSNRVTRDTLFRGFTPGDLVGPYVSQFLLKPIWFGTLRFNQRQRTVQGGVDYMTSYADWLSVQNGDNRGCQDQFDLSESRYIRNMRDLANYVHFDALYEAYLNACLILLSINAPSNRPCEPGVAPGAPFDPGNPYTDSITQNSFGTFGGPHILSLVTEVATRALKAVWYQKWFVHRRLRPEAFGGLIHNHLDPGKNVNYPIDEEILDLSPGSVLDRIHDHNMSQFNDDTYLLPQAFPEGSPTHPSYGAGHATVAGACVTILKTWFDESYVIPDPKVPNNNGTALVDYTGPDANSLTLGGELNKIAANIAIGRNMGGVHWRSDYTESVKLGEKIAIGILEEQRTTYNEPHRISLTKFDGTTVQL